MTITRSFAAKPCRERCTGSAASLMHTLYRDNRTGVYMLSPGKFAPVQMLLSLIPLWFASIFTLSFLTMMVAAVVCTVQGFMSL